MRARRYLLRLLSSLSVPHPDLPPPVFIYHLSTMAQQCGWRFTMMPCKEDHALVRLEPPVSARVVFIKQFRYFHSIFSLYPVDGEEERPQEGSERLCVVWGG